MKRSLKVFSLLLMLMIISPNNIYENICKLKLEDYNPEYPVDFCSFNLRWNGENWTLAFDNIKSTTIDGVNRIIGGAKVDEYPTEEEFIKNIIKKGLTDGVLSFNNHLKILLDK